MERTSGARTGGRVLSLLRRTVLNSNCNVQLVFDAMPSLIGTIRLEKLQLVFPGAVTLSFEINGKTESVLMKEKVCKKFAIARHHLIIPPGPAFT